MITSIGLHNLNSVVIPRLGFPFSKIFFSKSSFQISKKKIILKALGLDHSFLVEFPFSFKNNKSGSLSLFYKIESWKQIFISHLVCFWAPSEKIFNNIVMQGKKTEQCQKSKGKVAHLGGRLTKSHGRSAMSYGLPALVKVLCGRHSSRKCVVTVDCTTLVDKSW
jgi:hypothetical protein